MSTMLLVTDSPENSKKEEERRETGGENGAVGNGTLDDGDWGEEEEERELVDGEMLYESSSGEKLEKTLGSTESDGSEGGR